jgi:hypothetical protein
VLNIPLAESAIPEKLPWQYPVIAEHAEVLFEVSFASVVCVWPDDHEDSKSNGITSRPRKLYLFM